MRTATGCRILTPTQMLAAAGEYCLQLAEPCAETAVLARCQRWTADLQYRVARLRKEYAKFSADFARQGNERTGGKYGWQAEMEKANKEYQAALIECERARKEYLRTNCH